MLQESSFAIGFVVVPYYYKICFRDTRLSLALILIMVTT